MSAISAVAANQGAAGQVAGDQGAQKQANPDVSNPGFQNIFSGRPIPLVVQAISSARPNASVPTAAALNPAVEAVKPSVTAATQPAASPSAPSNLQTLTNGLGTPAESLAHSVAKSAAMGASTFRFHDNLQLPGSNPASVTPAAAVSAKTQSQDSSNGSLSGNSNAKSDGSLKVASVRTDEKTFVQSLDAVGANVAGARPAAVDPTAAAATTPVPAQTASPGAQAPAATSADLRAAQSLPGAAPNTPVVSAAHILNQSGQTEIRIEMQADSLGGVELRAHIAGDQIGASIAVEHHDAQMALAMDLPALHSALAEKNLRLESLTVSQGHFSSLNSDPGQDPGHQGFAHSPAKFAYAEPPEQTQALAETSVEWNGSSSNSSAGLSVVA
jgi:flagellar hook-length control protein FliK